MCRTATFQRAAVERFGLDVSVCCLVSNCHIGQRIRYGHWDTRFARQLKLLSVKRQQQFVIFHYGQGLAHFGDRYNFSEHVMNVGKNCSGLLVVFQ